MPMRCPSRLALALSALALATSCVVPDNATPSVNLGVDIASKYVHRGMVQDENGVMQTTGVIVLPTKKDGAIIARVWANTGLTNDTGDAWMPDGHAGRFSEIDFNLLYEQQLDAWTITSGFTSYNLPNGLEFPFGERGSTSEFMVEGAYQLPSSWLSIVPSLAVHYDYDEVEGFYIKAALGHEYAFNKKATLVTDLGIAWMDGEQAWWNFAQPDRTSGLSDLTLRGMFEYALDLRTTASVFLAYSRVVDSQYKAWFNELEIDSNQFYGGIGVSWAY